MNYRGYTIEVRNGAMGGVNAHIRTALQMNVHVTSGLDGDEALRRACNWIDSQQEEDADLFLNSLASRDQDVVTLEAKLAATEDRYQRVCAGLADEIIALKETIEELKLMNADLEAENIALHNQISYALNGGSLI